MDFPDSHRPFRGTSEQYLQEELPDEERQQLPQHKQEAPQPQKQQQPRQIGTHPLISVQQCSVPTHVEPYYPGPYHPDHIDFGTVSPDHDDLEGCAEILTRPRLTKEQVEVLEAQFQANPKPLSNVKRQLALQTNLTLPRVANWFQNRRAKAKQIKKQEEFEMAQSIDADQSWDTDSHLSAGYPMPLQIDPAVSNPKSLHSASSADASQASASSTSVEMPPGRDAAQEASWASLQRALDAAHHARHQYFQDQDQSLNSLPYGDGQPPVPFSESHDQGQIHGPSFSSLGIDRSSTEPWNLSSQPSEEGETGSGFDARSLDRHERLHDGAPSRVESPSVIQGYAISADVWPSTVPTPTSNLHAAPPSTLYRSESLPMPCFPSSTTNSPSDELTATLDQFALAGTPPSVSSRTTEGLDQFRKPERHVDIAARRKAPRPAALGPAALGPAALRSQSYGGQSALSPTFRFGRQPQIPQPIRHAKSVGQNLNVKYAGIRKPSPAQRSPLNMATFAEAEAFRDMVALNKTSQSVDLGDQGAPPTPLSNEDVMKMRLPIPEEPALAEPASQIPHEYLVNGQPSHLHMVSPPSTPMKPDFFAPPSVQGLMPAVSAPPQYAFLPDYTPPYSAGPLTAGSWSDAPLTSPGIATFPPTAQMSQPVFHPSMMQEYAPMASYSGPFSSLSPVEKKASEALPPANQDQTQTEFLIQEFPRQKEEHAHVAQQMASQKPKNYVFANATPSDF